MIPRLVFVVGDDQALSRAEALLTPLEREALAGYTFEKRRRDWLLGRLAAKLALCPHGPEKAEIRSGPKGQPLGFVAGEKFELSLTHGHDHAAALVADVPVGIDLEKLREVPERGWRFFLTPDERDWLAGKPLGPHGEIVAWALKEAAYKAVLGETEGMHHLGLKEVGEGRALIAHPSGDLVARYVVGPRFCLAVASFEPLTPSLPAPEEL